MLKLVAILFSMVLLSMNFALAVPQEETKLRLFQWRDIRVNAGYDIVFSGNLMTASGERIPNAEIIIKIDALCPADGIIAKGKTDSQGKYYIKTEALIWDKDNLIKAHAEFAGTEEYSPAISREQIIVIYKSHGRWCQE